MAFVKIEKAEKYYVWAASGLLALGVGAIIWQTTNDHANLPEPAGRVEREDGESLAEAVAGTSVGSVSFGDPGKLTKVGDDEYELAVVAQTWAWNGLSSTEALEIPKGSKVTFYVTSQDVVHGMRIPETQANIMIIPGQVSKVTVDFDEAGDYWIICHEYCGLQHHQMGAQLRVV